MLLLSTHLAGPRRRAAKLSAASTCGRSRETTHGGIKALGTVTDAYTYNTYGELATYSAQFGTTPLYSVTYDSPTAPRDGLGRVVQKTETLQGTTHVFGYAYDVQGRLTDVTRDGVAIEHYGYDANGNRTTATVNGTTVIPTYDDQDRLLTYVGTTFTYTANGELRTKSDSTGTTTYTYDAVGSLIAVSLPDGRLIEYVVDAYRRRIGKLVNGVLHVQWLYGERPGPVAELDGTGAIVSLFLYGSKFHIPELIVRSGTTYRLLGDQLGSPLAAVNTADPNDTMFQATYTAFGERTLTMGNDNVMPFGFAGGMYDPDTKLLHFGVRDYDSSIGRWVSKDPSRFDWGVNFYTYALNDPVNYVDITGLAPGSPGGGQVASCILCRAVVTGIGAVCETLRNPVCLVGTVPCSYACSYVCQGIDTDFLSGSGPAGGPDPGPPSGAHGSSSRGASGSGSSGSGGAGTR